MNAGNSQVEQALVEYLTRIKVLLPKEGPGCQLSPPDITTGTAHAERLIYILQEWYPTLVKFMKKATAVKNMAMRGKGGVPLEIPPCPEFKDPPPPLPPGSLALLANLVNRMNLANSDNHKLAELNFNLLRPPRNGGNRAFPVYSGSCVQGPNAKIGRIDFKKHGRLGVQIESRLFGQEWQELGREVTSPFLDTRPLKEPGVPEIREYRLRYWQGGVADGEWGPVLSISILP